MDDAAALLAYAQHGDTTAFDAFVRRHVDLVYCAALRQTGGRHHDAQEVTQHVFLVAARRAAALARHPRLLGWLHRAVHLVAREQNRAEARRRALADRAATNLALTIMENEPAAPGEGEHPESEWARIAPVLDEALRSLAELDREAVLARFFKQHAYAEVARALGTSENAARMRTERALHKLRRALARRGLRPGVAALATVLGQHAGAAAPAGVASAATAFATAAGSTALVAISVSPLMTPLLKSTLFAAISAAAGLGLGLAWPGLTRRGVDPAPATALVSPPPPVSAPPVPGMEPETDALRSTLARRDEEIERLRQQNKNLQRFIGIALQEASERARASGKSMFSGVEELGLFIASINARLLDLQQRFPTAPEEGSPERAELVRAMEEIQRDASLVLQDPLLSAEFSSGDPARFAFVQTSYAAPTLGLDETATARFLGILTEAMRERMSSHLAENNRPDDPEAAAAWAQQREAFKAATARRLLEVLTPSQQQRFRQFGYEELVLDFKFGVSP